MILWEDCITHKILYFGAESIFYKAVLTANQPVKFSKSNLITGYPDDC